MSVSVTGVVLATMIRSTPVSAGREELGGCQIAVGGVVHDVQVREESVLVLRGGDDRRKRLPSRLVGDIGADQQSLVGLWQALHGRGS